VNQRTWTIRDVLDWATKDFGARGIDSPRLDAELLVARALGVDRIELYLDLGRPLLEEERGAIRELLIRRREREPVAYIVGHRDFYGRRFSVTPDVLIPRPDTETLVEHALRLIPADVPLRVADVGTGSGAIAISIAAERPRVQVVATDVSQEALLVASSNALAMGVSDRIQFEEANLFGHEGSFDLVLSNPPYVRAADIPHLQEEVRDYEPSTALSGGEDGLDVVRALISRAAEVTVTGAQMLVEIGAGQARAVEAIANESATWQYNSTYLDLNRIERVAHLRRT